MIEKNKYKRPNYNLDFKQDAVKLVLENSYIQQQAGDYLGVSLSSEVG